jgi:hypothetical protein
LDAPQQLPVLLCGRVEKEDVPVRMAACPLQVVYFTSSVALYEPHGPPAYQAAVATTLFSLISLATELNSLFSKIVEGIVEGALAPACFGKIYGNLKRAIAICVIPNHMKCSLMRMDPPGLPR